MNRSLLKIIKTQLEGAKGYMAGGAAKYFVGIQDNDKDAYRRNLVSISIQKQGSHSSGSRTYKLQGWEPQ